MMDIRKVTAMTAIDLSAAFDTVDHDILLDVLENDFGVGGTVYKWCDSYLRPRKMKVCVNGAYSEDKDLNFSVPQGSCAGPVLYNAYASTMSKVVDEFENTNVTGYADDHSLYKSFDPDPESENSAIEMLELCLAKIKLWMQENRLKMNTDKTEFIYFGTSVQLAKSLVNEIKVENDTVSKEEKIKYLDAILDSQLTLVEQ